MAHGHSGQPTTGSNLLTLLSIAYFFDDFAVISTQLTSDYSESGQATRPTPQRLRLRPIEATFSSDSTFFDTPITYESLCLTRIFLSSHFLWTQIKRHHVMCSTRGRRWFQLSTSLNYSQLVISLIELKHRIGARVVRLKFIPNWDLSVFYIIILYIEIYI